jgi:acetamidase/formamidase
MEVTVRLTVRKDRSYVKTPHFKTISNSGGDDYSYPVHYCTTGIDSDIREATRMAVRNMIQFLVAEYKMDRVAAYMLCSVAGDLKMHEVVSYPIMYMYLNFIAYCMQYP